MISKLTELLGQLKDKDSLPQPEPEVFKVDLLRYPLWIEAFETFIERKTTEPTKRLYYLGKFTGGGVKESISGLLPRDTHEPYAKAKKVLSE